MSDDQDVLSRLKAREVIRELSIESPSEIDVEAIAFYYGLIVSVGKLDSARGRLTSNGKKGIVRVSDRVPEGGQRRFVIAHELGHHLLHKRKGLVSICLGADMLRYDIPGREAEANRFAAELLMPAKLFEPQCDVAKPSFLEVDRLAHGFRTTLTSAAIRFTDLCPEACALVFCENCAIKWFYRGPTFFGWFNKDSKLHSGTCAHDAFQGSPLRNAPEPVDASAWCENPGVDDLYEHTRYLANYNATLTLLWAPSI